VARHPHPLPTGRQPSFASFVAKLPRRTGIKGEGGQFEIDFLIDNKNWDNIKKRGPEGRKVDER